MERQSHRKESDKHVQAEGASGEHSGDQRPIGHLGDFQEGEGVGRVSHGDGLGQEARGAWRGGRGRPGVEEGPGWGWGWGTAFPDAP